MTTPPPDNTGLLLTLLIGAIALLREMNHRHKMRHATQEMKVVKPFPRIVLVDDSPDDGFLIKHLFESIGVENAIDYYPSASEAKAHMDDAPVLLVLSDIAMMRNGVDLLIEMKNNPRWQDIPIMLISGSQPKTVEIYERGAWGYVSKTAQGFDLLDFLKQLRTHGFSLEMKGE